MVELDRHWQHALIAVLAHAHTVPGDGIPALLDTATEQLGLHAELFLVDHEQAELRPLRPAAARPAGVDNSLAGRAYRYSKVFDGSDDGRPVLWVPLIDGVERLGVMRFDLPAGADGSDPLLRARCAVLSGMVAHVLVSKLQQSDALSTARSARPMSIAGELLWQLLPPLTVAGPRIALSGVLEPAYDVGGDAFDYEVGTDGAQFAIFDPSGHDLSAGLTASVTLAASRTARREGHDLPAVAARIDATLTEQFSDYRFVTGILARLDLRTGCLQYLNAGHPAPVLLRNGNAMHELADGRRLPFGSVASFATQPAEVGEEQLEPGDLLLLHSDGVVEARDADGEEFGLERLIRLAERAAADQLPAPETLRRLTHAVREHRNAELRDDATLLLVEWSGSATQRLLPSEAEWQGRT